jgi:hypothetical protein
MPLSLALVRTRLERYGRKNEALLHFFSCYALPVFIGLTSLLAVFFLAVAIFVIRGPAC